MCNRRRFTLVLPILSALIFACSGYKPTSLSNLTQRFHGSDGNTHKQPHTRAGSLHAAPVSSDEDTRFFGDVFSNPAYDHTIKIEKKKTPFHVKNKNTLKNLGRCHYEGILSQIQRTVQTRVDDEKGKAAAKTKKKKGSGLSEAEKESLLNATDQKRAIVCDQLRWISKRNNARTERVLRTSDFIDGNRTHTLRHELQEAGRGRLFGQPALHRDLDVRQPGAHRRGPRSRDHGDGAKTLRHKLLRRRRHSSGHLRVRPLSVRAQELPRGTP